MSREKASSVRNIKCSFPVMPDRLPGCGRPSPSEVIHCPISEFLKIPQSMYRRGCSTSASLNLQLASQLASRIML